MVRGYDSWVAPVVAVVNYLIELLLSPGAADLGTQVVQDQEGSVAHPLEKLVVPCLALRAIGSPNGVQQVRQHDKGHRVPPLEAVVGDGRRQVSLAAAVLPQKDEPVLGVFSKLAGGTESQLQVGPLLRICPHASSIEGLKGHAIEKGQAQACGLPVECRRPLLQYVNL